MKTVLCYLATYSLHEWLHFKVYGHDLWYQNPWVQIPALLIINFVDLSELLSLFIPQFLHEDMYLIFMLLLFYLSFL